MEESEIIKRCQEGDSEIFGKLVEKYKTRVFWIAFNMVRNEDEALDISQEAFLKAYNAIDRFQISKKFYTWLYQIVVNLCIDHLRRRSKKFVSFDKIGDLKGQEDPVEKNLIKQELKEEVRNILDRLPEKYKTVLVLRDIEGLSSLDIAKIVDCSHETARWRVHYARKMFKEEWERRKKNEV